MHTFLEKEIVRSTEFNGFLKNASVDFGGRKTGLPGEKPSKHRKNQLRELNSRKTLHHT